jgi:hypothetical protein
MNHKLIDGVACIENIFDKKGQRIADQKIIKGFRIMHLDKCYQMLEKIKNSLPIDVDILEKWSGYLAQKNIPFAITEAHTGKHIYYRLFVHGTEATRAKTESKKLPVSN